jgi:hypothetical protein
LKIIIKTLILFGLIAIIGFVVFLDIADRDLIYSKSISTDELNEFYLNNDAQQEAFERNFGNIKYKFPREKVAKIKLYKNKFLISRLTSKNLSSESILNVKLFFNNPDNFNWGETTWGLNEAEYILRFFNKKDEKIGQIWICIENCGMTEAIPFSPNMKYGGMSEKGNNKINEIISIILDE